MTMTVIAFATALATASQTPAAGPRSGAPGLDDLLGVRGSAGQAEMEARGYVNVGGRIVDGDVWTWWWNADFQRCATIVTRDGRFDRLTSEPAVACGPDMTPPVRPEIIRFARGRFSARREGRLAAGDRTIYRLTLRAGQRIHVELDSQDCTFDLQAPRSSDVMHKGDVQGQRYEGVAPTTGEYLITVARPTAPGAGGGFGLRVRAQ